MATTVSNDDPTVSIERPCIYVVATPIGNLKDFSFHARTILQGVDLILAEDTRVSGKLLGHFGISTKMRAFHDHNERQLSAKLLDLSLIHI